MTATKRAGGIYTASKTVHAPRWRELRDEGGRQVVSTWIDEAGVGESGCLTDLWRRCIEESSGADVLVVVREGEEVLKGAFVELGAALASDVPVLASGIDEFSFACHPAIRHCGDAATALAMTTDSHLHFYRAQREKALKERVRAGLDVQNPAVGGIYFASNRQHMHLWRFQRDAMELPVSAPWIDDFHDGIVLDPADQRALWVERIRAASAADVLVFYRMADEPLDEAWVDLGAALAAGVPVMAVGIEEFTVSNHRDIRHFDRLQSAIDAANDLVAEKKLDLPLASSAAPVPSPVGL